MTDEQKQNSKPKHITITLHRINDLFTVPDFTVHNGAKNSRRIMSGFDEILHKLKTYKKISPGQIIIAVPAREIWDTSSDEIKEAIDNYTSLRIEQNIFLIFETKAQGAQALWRSLLLIAITLPLAVLVYAALEQNIIIRDLIGGGFIILAWVGLWSAFEPLFFDWLPYREENKILEQIKNLQIDLLEI
jgi:hypothetical protein